VEVIWTLQPRSTSTPNRSDRIALEVAMTRGRPK